MLSQLWECAVIDMHHLAHAFCKEPEQTRKITNCVLFVLARLIIEFQINKWEY
jgi:hypothetical protein